MDFVTVLTHWNGQPIGAFSDPDDLEKALDTLRAKRQSFQVLQVPVFKDFEAFQGQINPFRWTMEE